MKASDVPVIINNRNRLSTLKKLVTSLERAGSQEIYIIDNQSTYEPLLAYYQHSPHKVIRLLENVGYLSFWELGICEQFKKRNYIYTDPDVVPAPDCPLDFIELFSEGLARYKDVQKVGFSLKIDDLPDCYAGKAAVLKHEGGCWINQRSKLFYNAPIDTTFALYRPGARGGHWIPALRSAPPYSALHLPWYVDSKNLDEEEIYYRKTANEDASWTHIEKKI